MESERLQDRNKEILDLDFIAKLNGLFLKAVKIREEDDTGHLEKVLDEFTSANLSGGVDFCHSSQDILALPDLIAERTAPEKWGTGLRSEHKSPEKRARAPQRRRVAAAAVKLYLDSLDKSS